jgi:histidine triad (HIT) family protein
VTESEDCIFCRIRDGEIPSEFLHRDEKAFAIRDISPRAPVHILIIPTEHIPSVGQITDTQLPVMGTLTGIANRLAASEGISESGYRLAINNGPDAHMSVPHLHLHLIGGRSLGPEG